MTLRFGEISILGSRYRASRRNNYGGIIDLDPIAIEEEGDEAIAQQFNQRAYDEENVKQEMADILR